MNTDKILEVCDDRGTAIRVGLSEQDFTVVKRFLEATLDSGALSNIQFVKLVENIEIKLD